MRRSTLALCVFAAALVAGGVWLARRSSQPSAAAGRGMANTHGEWQTVPPGVGPPPSAARPGTAAASSTAAASGTLPLGVGDAALLVEPGQALREVQALVNQGTIGAARARAEHYLRELPDGPEARQIESLTGVHPHP
jgi:hypothetical protein